MTLEDTPKPSPDSLEMGDKLFTLPSNKINLVLFGKSEDIYMMNHGKYAMFYFVQRIPPNPLTTPPTLEKIIIHWIPKSREDELKPE